MDLSSSSLHYETAPEEMLIYEEDSNFTLANETFVSVEEQFTGDYLNAEFHERSSILVDGGENFGVSALAFDTHEELLWMGNQGGHVTSYFGPDLQKYTSFQVHMTDEIRCLHSIDGGILALSPNSLRYQMRRGLPIYTFSSVNMEEMQCLVPMRHCQDSFLLSGHNPRIIELNLAEGREVQMIDVGEGGCAIMRQQNRYLCCGEPTGKVELRDPLTLKVEHSLETHSASLSDFDVHGNLLVTCGFSNRQGTLSCDPLLLVFDLRMLRALAPINLLLDPLLLRFMPSYSSRLAVASTTGQLQFVETVVSEPDMTLYQVNWPSAGCVVSSLDVCSSSQAVVVGGSGGSLHLLSSTQSPLYNAFSRPTEFADPIENYDGPINLDDTMAVLASIPLPLTDGPLLSDWPKQFVSRGYRRTPSIDPEILRTMKMQGTVGYAPNPNTRRRNQVSETYIRRSEGRGSTPNATGSGDDQQGFVAIPKRYRKPEIKYNKTGGPLGEGETDLEHYSKSGLSGLEATLPNSYCNAMLQVLYFTESLRSVMLTHQCLGEFCVCCELGFLFHMLGSGAPCHSGNLLRALRSAKEASALRLILSDTSAQDANLLLLIQSWNRFILHQMHSELLEAKRKEIKMPSFVYRDTDFPSIELQNQRKKKVKPEMSEEILEDTTKGETEVSKLFGSKQTHVFTCLKCNNKSSKEATLLVHNLVYPHTKGQISSLSLGENNDITFCQVLQASVGGSQITPAWCEPCYKFQPTLQERRVKTLPPILSINCGNNNETDKKFWKDQMDAVVLKVVQGSGDVKSSGNTRHCRYGSSCTRVGCRFKHPQQMTEIGISVPSHLYQSHSWVPLSMIASLSESGQITVKPKSANSEIVKGEVIYDIYGVVCYVNDEKKNVVALVNVSSVHEIPMWYIFNDYSITPVGGQEAVWFSMDWKVPCVLYWRQTAFSQCDSELGGDMYSLVGPPPPISPEVLLNVPKCATIIPLSPSELPKQGDLVAIDAEFVTLNQEESELRSDGKLATVKPSHMSVARISCVRGQGPLEGTAFIDDYISTQEQVFDYLTKFSGIKPGDLDATCSSKNLTTLKSTYLKLRYLIDNGVTFVGHGLNNDFRVINVVVPPNQIIDTVQLFYLPHQRMVSLRFLAWHFIGIKIQSETHDSIEDARAALRLYKKYVDLESQGILQNSLEEMYNVGKSLHWKVPGVDTD